MIALTIPEAQLFRLLVDFFGRERVVPQMSVVAACGGAIPPDISQRDSTLESWAKKNKCLFTIVDTEDTPCMVVEFFSGFEQAIDATEEEHQRLLSPLLKAAGVRYVTISPSEFSEMLDPGSSLDFFTLLKAKVEQDEGVVA